MAKPNIECTSAVVVPQTGWNQEPTEAGDDWYDVEVAEDARGRGLGRRLMERAEDEGHRRDGTALGLNVFGPNTRARRLYESLGYEPTSIRVW
jgi:ribosomal protein S18 acetylase RimI-like enzyme